MKDSDKLYRCDPQKNIKCKKTICKYNETVLNNTCELTIRKEYSIDGVPINPEEYPPGLSK